MECNDEEVFIQAINKSKNPFNSSVCIPSTSELIKIINEEQHSLSVLKSKKKKKNKKKKKIIIIAQNKLKEEHKKRSKSSKRKKKHFKDNNKVEMHINRFSTMKHQRERSELAISKSLTIKQLPLKPLPQVKKVTIINNVINNQRSELIPIKEVIRKEQTNITSFNHIIDKDRDRERDKTNNNNYSLSVLPNKQITIKQDTDQFKKIEAKSTLINSAGIATSFKYKSNYQDRKNYFQIREEKGERIAQYIIKQGNASHLIKNCMNHRVNWKEPFSSVTSLYNFKWQELSYGIEYPHLSKMTSIKQAVNHFEFHNALSNKSVMFINFLKYCEDNSLSVFKYAPLTIILKTDKPNTSFYKLFDNIKEYICDYNQIEQSCDDNIKDENNFSKWFPFEKEENNGIGAKTKIQIPRSHYKGKNLWVVKASNLNRGQCIKVVDSIEKIESWIKMFNDGIELGYDAEETDHNHQANNNNKNSTSMTNNNNATLNSNPSTANTITSNNNTSTTTIKVNTINNNRANSNNNNKTVNVIDTKEISQSYLIANPTINQSMNKTLNLNQFKTITSNIKANDTNPEMINKTARQEIKQDQINQINQLSQKSQTNTPINNPPPEVKKKIYQSNRIIIQKYIENPFLYRGRKCDMRIWVLITHKMKVYMFKEGHLKTCSVEYDLNVNDTYVHITNYSFQKHSSNFGKFEDGNEVPFSDLEKFIEEEHSKKHIRLSDILVKIKEIIQYTTRSVHSKINKLDRKYSFEIFGYDFMLDNDFNVFLIEINTNPGLELSSPWIKLIVPRLLDDALRLTIDQLFDTKYCFDSIKEESTQEDDNNYNQMRVIKNKEMEKMLANTITLPDCHPEHDLIKHSTIDALKRESNKDISKPIDVSVSMTIRNNYSLVNNITKDGGSKAIVINDEKKPEYNHKVNINEAKIHNKSSEVIDGIFKYKSPFPVPGYEDNDNLWEYICDLNDEVIKEKEKEKMKEKESKAYSGIRHLLKKKTKAKKNK